MGDGKDTHAQTGSRRRLWVLGATAAALGTVLACRSLDLHYRPSLVSGPMVQIPQPGELTIVWYMTTSGAPARGGARLVGGGLDLSQTARRVDDRYEATFRGLRPGRGFQYTIFGAGFLGREIELAGPLPIRLPPAPGQPFRFLAFGDSGNGSHTQAGLAELMAQTKPDLIIHTGDVVYPAGAAEDYRYKFFEPNRKLIASTPFMPSLGNHDVATDRGQPLLDVFVLPENGPPGTPAERNYWFDFGDARFVALDTNLDDFGVFSREQMKGTIAPWVRSVFENSDAKWRFVYYHHPFYTGSQHPADGQAYVKEAFLDVFDECLVDVVFCGHNHLYERTQPMRGDRVADDGNGTIYVVTGAGGASRYPESEAAPDYIVTFHDATFSFTQVDVTPEALVIKQIEETGAVVDQFRLTGVDRPNRKTQVPPPSTRDPIDD